MADQLDPDAFRERARARRPTLPAELFYLLRTTKKWWLTPIVLSLVLLAALALAGGSAAAPFIYTLF